MMPLKSLTYSASEVALTGRRVVNWSARKQENMNFASEGYKIGVAFLSMFP
jgi:hypothetical protein